MLNIGKIAIRDIKELQDDVIVSSKNSLTPLRKRKNLKSAESIKKLTVHNHDNETVIAGSDAITTTLTKTSRKRLKSALKETPSNQKRIDSYFSSCPKSYDIKFPKSGFQTPLGISDVQTATTKTKGSRNIGRSGKSKTTPKRPRAKRKRLFTDSTENMSVSDTKKKSTLLKPVAFISIDSESEEEIEIKCENASPIAEMDKVRNCSTPSCSSQDIKISTQHISDISQNSLLAATASSLSFGQRMSKTSCEKTVSVSHSTVRSSALSRRKTKPCPPYKIIENTTFAVDAFQFGYIENVTHYFLTHFHADHYIGLTKSFAMPLFMSPITARLVRTFIGVQEQYIHELELNQTYTINNMEVTALEANHCPGAILLVFKFPDSDKCVLHTGDFRACHEMESEPIFWNNHIHTIYLDTTYISDKYAFCTQYESIMKAQDLIEKFHEKHAGKRILYICGAYIIGKEKFWSTLAEKYEMKVWAEGNRYKALHAIDDERLNRLLVKDPNEANMHVIPMGKLSYLELSEYFKLYEQQYDIVFAIRPSGWEKNSKPRYGSKINVVGIEYSEHSSYEEMQRFVKFLKPEQVISTVPSGRDLMKTSKVPTQWYKYDKLKVSSNYQPSIDSFLAKTPLSKLALRLPNVNKGGVEKFVSPLKATTPNIINNNNNITQDKSNSIISSKSTKSNERTEVKCKRNTNECSTQQSVINSQNHKNTTRTEAETIAISIANSSEYFEKPDIVIKTKNLQQNRQKLQENAKNNILPQTKPKRNKIQLTPKKSNMKANAKKSEIKLQNENKSHTENKTRSDKNAMAIEQTTTFNSLYYSSEDEFNNLHTKSQTPGLEISKQQELEISISQKRITRSKRASIKSTSSVSQTRLQKTKQHDKTLSSKSNSQKTRSCETKNSTSSDGFQAWHETIKQNLEIPPSQKRMTTRSKSASNKNSSSSFNCQTQAEQDFESRLLKLTEQNDKKINSKRKLKSTTINLHGSKENPIFKSTTDSIADTISADEIKSRKSAGTEIKSTTSDTEVYNYECPTKLGGTKRHALNHSLKHLKKSKTIINTQAILNTILEQSEDIDRFNCSQLAGLVVDTLHKQNPDNNRDHIPIELLSDADDDWLI